MVFALLVVAAMPQLSHAQSSPRRAWVPSTAGNEPAMMLTPRRALVPLVGSLGPRKLSLCTPQGGCADVVRRWSCRVAECGIPGRILEVDRDLAQVEPLRSPEAIHAALLKEPAFAKIEEVDRRRNPPPDEHLDEFMVDDPALGGPGHPHDEARQVSWWRGHRWEWEAGLAGLLTGLGTGESSGLSNPDLGAGLTVRAGVRRFRRPRTWHAGIAHAIGAGLEDAAIGRHFGADACVHWLGRTGSGSVWAVGIRPVAALPLPEKGDGKVAVRMTTLLGMLLPEVGLGSVGGDVGLHVRFGYDFALLVLPRGGLELSAGLGRVYGTPEGLSYFTVGLGGFVR